MVRERRGSARVVEVGQGSCSVSVCTLDLQSMGRSIVRCMGMALANSHLTCAHSERSPDLRKYVQLMNTSSPSYGIRISYLILRRT